MSASRKTTRSRSASASTKGRPSSEPARSSKKAPSRAVPKKSERPRRRAADWRNSPSEQNSDGTIPGEGPDLPSRPTPQSPRPRSPSPLSKKAARAAIQQGADAEAFFNDVVRAVVSAIGKRLDDLDRRLTVLEREPRAAPYSNLHVGPPMGSPVAAGDPLVTFEVEIPSPGVTAGPPSILYRGSKEPG